MGETTVTLATLTDLATAIGSALTWFWTIFTNLVNSIASNDILLWTTGFAIVAGSIFAAVKVIRKFGIKSRR